MSSLTVTFAIIAALFLGIGLILFFKYIFERQSLTRALSIRLLSVKLPQKAHANNGSDKRDVLAEINNFAQLLGSLSGKNSLFTLELAVHNAGEEIHFYLAVPRMAVEFVSRQIQGLWPGATVAPADEYTIFDPHGSIVGGYLAVKKTLALPIRTYEDANLDTFAPILSSFSKLKTVGEGLVLQIIGRPAPKSVKKRLTKAIELLKKGGKMTARGVTPPPPRKKDADSNERYIPPTVDEESLKLVTRKVSKPLFEVNVRLIASAGAPERTNELFDGLAGAFNQFSAPLHNDLKLVVTKNPRTLAYQYAFREFSNAQVMTLSADEVASFFHFPTTATSELPRLQWNRGKQVESPANLPKSGTPIGESFYRNESKPVMITDDDRRRHVYLVGQTGTGKSTLMQNMIRADIEKGKGVALIDPHGDLIDEVLAVIPEDRIKDVIVFNPGELSRPLGLNMLENNPDRPEEKTFIVNEMQGIFNKLFSEETMGPMFEQYMRNALLLLMEDRDDPATLIEVPRVFTDVEFRKRKLAKAKNPTVVDFWEKEAAKAGGEASLANMTPYITSKFNNFLANDYVRPIIGQRRSAFNFRKVMDEQKILLVNLAKGRIGDINAGLLGMVIVGKLLMAALSRVDTPQENRKDFNLYIDEFQNFTTDSIATILSEARKYRLNLVIAHQFIAQLTEKIRDSVFGNVGSVIAFRVGADDAETLVKQFEPVFEKNDLLNIDNRQAYVRLLINGATSSPFNIKTYPPARGSAEIAVHIKENSLATYGRPREEIETDILRRLRT